MGQELDIMSRKFQYILLFCMAMLLGACESVAGEVAYTAPVIPLRVSINTRGEISLGIEHQIELPTSLGTFSIGVVADPTRRFNVTNTLTIRVDNQEHFYDLHGNDFSIEFESGYYEEIKLKKTGDDIFLSLRKIEGVAIQPNSQSSNNTNPTRASEQSSNHQNECNELFSPRLKIGRTAEVIVFQVTVRRNPDKDSSRVNYFARDRILEVIDGPVCADGWYWWELYSEELGYGGWVAEADEENYYLSP